MQIGKIIYPISTLGPGKRIGIWVLGCNRFCVGCSNPELQFFDESKDISVDELLKFLLRFTFDGVTISGGEPFLQPKELASLIQGLKKNNIEDILVYTGFLKEELEGKRDKYISSVLENIAVLIDGPFVQELKDEIPLRGSSNQKLYVLKDKFKEQYEDFLKGEKRVDIFEFGCETHFIGIPLTNYEKLYSDYMKNK